MDIVLANTPLFLTGVFLFGLLIGSFLNVVILRLPRMMDHQWRCDCRELLDIEAPSSDEPVPTLTQPPSTCPKCGHRIRAIENVPVLSWLVLRGRCSACKAPISARYPATELLTAIAFLVVAWTFGPTWQCLGGLVFTAMLIAMAGIDLDHQLLPDNLTLPLLWMGLLFSFSPHGLASLEDSVLGAVAGYGLLWGVYHLFLIVTGKEGMGFGDFKLMGALGAWLGWQAIPLIVILSSLSGAIIGGTAMLLQKDRRGKAIPFGPFLAAGGWIYLIWGDELVNAYLRFSGLAP